MKKFSDFPEDGICDPLHGNFKCEKLNRCISYQRVCNSVPDCPDHSDEQDGCRK